MFSILQYELFTEKCTSNFKATTLLKHLEYCGTRNKNTLFHVCNIREIPF